MVSDLTLYHDSTTGLEYAGDIGETTPVSWQPRREYTFDELKAICNTMATISGSLNWWVGDLLNYADSRFGEMASQLYDLLGWDYSRVSTAKWVTKVFMSTDRSVDISWTHHHEIARASFGKEESQLWLRRAVENGWSVRRLRDEIRGPQIPIALSPSDLDDAPFNHRTRNGIPADERTAVDEYEQQDDVPIIYDAPTSIHFSSETPEHYTPPEIIDAAIACMGGIDLDPCSNSKTEPNVPAMIHYDQEDDGLAQAWRGRVYMNPPYGREIGAWVERLCAEHAAGNVTQAIALVPARTDTQWFKKLRDYPACFVEGRLTFIGNDDPAPFPSAVFYLGDDIGAFHYAFSGFGDIWQRIEPPMFGA